MALALRYAVRSDRGLVRGNNEDSVYAGPRLLAIADGMGGHAAGEVASKLVIGAMEHLDEDRHLGDLLAALRTTVVEANHGISEAVTRDPSLEGMGTTLTALRFVGSKVGLVHVGDSRAYLLRANELAQITHDDTYVQSLVDQGKLTADEAAHHPRKSVILRALTGTDVDPDVSIREARPGDRYLLCSDGLSDVVTTTTIAEAMRSGDPQECADRLVELALRGGGPDNVTCIVADVIDTEGGDEGDDMPVIGGAFVDPGDATIPLPEATSPAERAARMTQPSPPAPPPAAPPRRRTPAWRPILLVGLVLAIIAGGLAATYAWTQSQYFVGRDGTDVAIFRGVDTEFGPVKFFTVDKNHFDLKVADLKPAARAQVENGITASSEKDAENIIANLRGEQLPDCPVRVPTGPTTAPPSTVTGTPVVTSTAGLPGGSKSDPQVTASSTASDRQITGAPSASGSSLPTVAGTGATASTSPTPRRTPTQPKLGVDCK